MGETVKMTKNELVAEVKRLTARVAALEETRTRLEKTENELQEAQARHRGLFENLPSAVAVYRASGQRPGLCLCGFQPGGRGHRKHFP